MTPCREWQGHSSSGYGVKWDKVLKKNVYMHRWVVAEIEGWQAIEGLMVCHRCDNPLCYRYDHLFIGSNTDNMRDLAAKGRHWNQQKTHCPAGHEYTPSNTFLRGGKRLCKVCARATKRASKQRRHQHG